VAALDAAVRAALAQGALPGVVETMPTFRSLTVLYDPLRTRRHEVQAALAPLLANAGDGDTATGRRWCLPVAYGGQDGGAAGADLDGLASAAGLSPAQVIDLHAGTTYRVYMIGFLPGFPFMGDLAAPLHRPRRTEPRLRVPAGAVAVANGLTAVYPWQSPGGWHLLGRCPVPLFDAKAASPSLLAPGDRVRFEPVGAARLAELEAAIKAGELPIDTWLETADA
jgi:KipI family sensor histidine kinase inhibitor